MATSRRRSSMLRSLSGFMHYRNVIFYLASVVNTIVETRERGWHTSITISSSLWTYEYEDNDEGNEKNPPVSASNRQQDARAQTLRALLRLVSRFLRMTRLYRRQLLPWIWCSDTALKLSSFNTIKDAAVCPDARGWFIGLSKVFLSSTSHL
ncbi:hypothetical protein PC110_g22969 [Phytophthora cactorum]|uniref:Uncharacterized protein n=1 Tax=Phytophthora cactorum TaxID=29920 RepID=A0A329R9D4_9STRA|nr:hypothetical protein PC110_g22969 [Phytophthora cactorum]